MTNPHFHKHERTRGVAITQESVNHNADSVNLLFFQPLADHGDSHVLPAGDRLKERVCLHPVQTSTELCGEDHIQKEAPRTDYIQVWQQQLSWSGDISS